MKPLQTDGKINFVDVGPSLQIEEKLLQELGPKEFWNSLPINELERAVLM